MYLTDLAKAFDETDMLYQVRTNKHFGEILMLKCLKALLTQLIACFFEWGLYNLSHKLVHVYSLATLDAWLQFFKEWTIPAKVSLEVANTASH